MGINVESRMTEHARLSIQKTAARPPGLRPKLKAKGLRKSATRFIVAGSRREHLRQQPDQCGAERMVALIPSDRSGSVFQRTRNGRFMFSRR